MWLMDNWVIVTVTIINYVDGQGVKYNTTVGIEDMITNAIDRWWLQINFYYDQPTFLQISANRS